MSAPRSRRVRSEHRTCFYSARERRLWAWTLAVLVATFSSRGLLATLAGALRNHRALIDNTIFFVVLPLCLLTMVTQGLKRRPRRNRDRHRDGMVPVYLLVFQRIASTEARPHPFEYSLDLEQQPAEGPRPVPWRSPYLDGSSGLMRERATTVTLRGWRA